MKFVFITDTHLGSDGTGFHQQPTHPQMLGEILAALDGWIAGRGDIDFVLHGGDVVDRGTATNIEQAAQAFRLCVPVYVALGNHDLTEPDSLETWLQTAPHFFDGQGDFTLSRQAAAIHLAVCQWGDQPYLWNKRLDAHLLAAQQDRLLQAIANQSQRRHVLCMHSPVLGIPVEQSGQEASLHAPPEPFERWALDLACKGPIALCLGGHSHANTCCLRDGTCFVTASSLIETPFEFKLVSIDADWLEVETVSLAPLLGQTCQIDQAKAYVLGRACDRAVRLSLS